MRFLLFGVCLFLLCGAALCASLASERLSAAANVAASGFHTNSVSYNWILYSNTNFVSGLIPSPGSAGTFPANGWVNYGAQSTLTACQSACDNDAECWAYTWHDQNQGSYALYCYGRQPWTNPLVFGSITGASGHYSGYKEVTSFGNSFNQLYTGINVWTPPVSKTTTPGINYFSGAFANPNTQYWSLNSGYLELNGIVVSSAAGSSQLVQAQSGGINIGAVMSETMCAAALDFNINLLLVNGNPTIAANYYSFMEPGAGGGWDNACFLGSINESSASQGTSNSGVRSGSLPTISLI